MSTTENLKSLEDLKWEKAGRIAKNVGKGLLTLVSPPIGLAAFCGKFHGKNRRIEGAITGLLLSTVSSLGVKEIKEKTIYDNPYVHTEVTIGARVISEILISPLAFHLDMPFETAVRAGEGDSRRVYGKDVITFDSDEGEYVLNFDYGRPFRNNKGSFVSRDDAQERVREAYQKYEALVEQGNVMEARGALEKWEHEYALFRDIVKEEGEVRKVYSDVVDKMNVELAGHKAKTNRDNAANIGEEGK